MSKPDKKEESLSIRILESNLRHSHRDLEDTIDYQKSLFESMKKSAEKIQGLIEEVAELTTSIERLRLAQGDINKFLRRDKK